MSSKDTFNVAVTGSAPFMEFDFNTSSMVRDALPKLIEQTNKRKIKIFKYARVTRDTYEDVRRVSKEIWGGQRALFLPEPGPSDTEQKVDIDVILHLGMVALGWGPDQFRFETIACRDGYELPGDDGKYVDSRKLKELGLPETLATSFDIEAAWSKVKEKFPDEPIFLSHDAGLYFCEFRLYSSLAAPHLTEAH
ncbi:cut9-interacting protein scn1 [Physcia stellaris]|nr:cut9-interacting protein scn1 [Physcia stellaris]